MEAERQLREVEKITAERGKEQQESENLKQEINKTFKRIRDLEEQQGSNLENEAELQRLKMLKKNYETDLENKKRQIAALQKLAKNREKAEKRLKQNVQSSLKKKEKET